MLYPYACLRVDVQSGGALSSALVNSVMSRRSEVKISGACVGKRIGGR